MDKVNVQYPKKVNPVHWDTLNVEYPVTRQHETGRSSSSLAHQLRSQPEILREPKEHLEILKYHDNDFKVTTGLNLSQTTIDFGYKYPEATRFNKHTSCLENEYIYPPSRQLEERVPAVKVHGTTEMRGSYRPPTLSARLVTDKDQFKHPVTVSPPFIEPSWHKELPPIDTTHDGFEKYLDPYLTTSRLHHRPFTADQLARPSASQDIVTYYTYDETPWTRRPKPGAGEWWLPIRRPKSMYDREKFNQDFREIRTHNKPVWVPGTFRTDVRDNYVPPASRIQNYEDVVRNQYQKAIARLPTNVTNEDKVIKTVYRTENGHIGSGRPLSSVIHQRVQKSKKLQR